MPKLVHAILFVAFDLLQRHDKARHVSFEAAWWTRTQPLSHLSLLKYDYELTSVWQSSWACPRSEYRRRSTSLEYLISCVDENLICMDITLRLTVNKGVWYIVPLARLSTSGKVDTCRIYWIFIQHDSGIQMWANTYLVGKLSTMLITFRPFLTKSLHSKISLVVWLV